MRTWKRSALWNQAVIVLLVVAVSGKALIGQSSGGVSRPPVSAVNGSWPEINLNVVVLDKQGNPERLDSSEFRLFEDGVEKQIQSFADSDAPISLAFLIDTSGSIHNRGPRIAAAVTTIIRTLPAGSEVMSVLFADEAYLDLPFTPVSKIDLSFLDRQNAHGGTPLFDTVVVAERYCAAHAKFARRALVLFSDGGDNSSRSQKADAIRSVQLPSAPAFYSFILSMPHGSRAESRNATRTMEDLARAGGGISITPSRDEDFELAANRLAGVIRNQEALTFTAVDPALDGKKHELKVQVPVDGLQVFVSPVYYAPAK